MTIALSTILIILFLFPGIGFRLFYRSSLHSRERIDSRVVRDIFWSILPAFLIHSALVGLSNIAAWFPGVNFNYILNFIYFGPYQGMDLKPITSNVGWIFTYNIVAVFVGVLSGWLAREAVLKYKLDCRFEPLRFSNNWHYILSGRVLDFPKIPHSFEDISIQRVDILCNEGGEPYTYSGTYFDHTLDSNGKMESIILGEAYKIDSNGNGTSVDSLYLTVRGEQILNIGVQYYKVEDVEDTIEKE